MALQNLGTSQQRAIMTAAANEPECFLSLRTGTVTCMNTASAGELPAALRPIMNTASELPAALCPIMNTASAGELPAALCPTPAASSLLFDSPLSRILQREAVGPWTRVGYVTTGESSSAQSRDRTMALYAQTVDTRRNRYNYRVADSNGIALDLAEKVIWIADGEAVTIPSQSAPYVAHLYREFR